MACVHNIIIRGFNSIYLQAPKVKPSDYKDFVGYSLAWWEVIHSHHEGEEAFLFPEIERQAGEKGIMDSNIDQHKAFHSGLEAFRDYLVSLHGKEREFAGEKLVMIMDSFKEPLAQHLDDEIPTLLSLAKYGDKVDLLPILKEEAEKAMGNVSKVGPLPLFLLNHDVTYENGLHANFPPIPKPIKLLLTHVYTCWNWGWWKFASCDVNGRPKPLYGT